MVGTTAIGPNSNSLASTVVMKLALMNKNNEIERYNVHDCNVPLDLNMLKESPYVLSEPRKLYTSTPACLYCWTFCMDANRKCTACTQ